MSAKRFSESFFFSSGASKPRPSKIHGMTMLSVTPASASSRCPSTPNLSMHTAWNSNGSSARPYSARSALSLPMVSANCSPVIIALVQPSPMRAARRSATSVWPPT